MNEVTRILSNIESGEPAASEKLLPLVYDELRRLAAARMVGERADHSLDATALVHEAYLRLGGDQKFEGRAHFFAAAAEAMRRVLVDHSRNRARLKRGGGKKRIDLDRLMEPASATNEELLALDEALGDLARQYPEAAELVKLRFFAGMTMNEAAEALQLSPRTANRQWAFARAWLAASLTRE
ncbi:ECF-type sigma factor [Paludisphaera mucosa]|uniref:ECF-type sigma factor n=1 Tax=Paludisphaera mucosa TaxID=3030827 RepID=A0ABT6FLL6_9BACT|nr:ECF-type sigma factor [Paludisphaera mucosa]MDG3008414.1 ECF-type sigma factor [Paludisphaera mucosa]